MIRRFGTLVLVLLMTVAPGAYAQLTDGSTLVGARGSTGRANGATPGSAAQIDPFTGASTFAFPLVVPPGTAGMQPSLALQYNSQRTADSWVGFGWGLGTSSIRRSTKDGIPTYDDAQDTFLLDGEELVPDPSIAGRFHTRRESYRRIDQLPDKTWEVRTPDGQRLRYGTRLDALIATGPAQIFALLLTEVEDRNGNVMQFSYDRRDANTAYLKEIRYTLRRTLGGGLQSVNGGDPGVVDRVVEFQLEARPDPFESYLSGLGQTFQGNRLARIFVKVGGNLIRRYDLSYEQSPDSGRSLLASVSERGSDAGTFVSPNPASIHRTTTFDYSSNVEAGTQGYQEVAWSVPSSAHFVTSTGRDGGTRLGDVNGDGLPDLVIGRASTQGLGTLPVTAESGAYLNTGSGFSTTKAPGFAIPQQFFFTAQLPPVPGAPAQPFPVGTLLLDMNQDGRAELLGALQVYQGNPSSPPVLVDVSTTPRLAVNTGTGWQPTGVSSDFFGDPRSGTAALSVFNNPLEIFDGSVLLVELNGDGNPDVYVNELGVNLGQPPGNDAAETFYSSLNLGNNAGFGTPDTQSFRVCDPGEEATDGDPTQAPGFECTVTAFQTLKAFSTNGQTVVVLDAQRFGARFLDLNADGLGDQARAFMSATFDIFTPLRKSYINDGSDFVANDLWNVPPIFDDNVAPLGPTFDEGVRIVDVNADGRVDLVQAVEGGARNVWLNTGFPDGADPNRPWNAQPGGSPLQIPSGMEFVGPTGNRKDRGVRMADLDGDGMEDLIRIQQGASPRVFLNRGAAPDLLVSVTNPFGGESRIEYGPSTAFDNTGSDSLPDLPVTVQVQTALEVDAGGGSQVVRTTFEYAGGMFDPQDREFRGFRMVRERRAFDNRTTETLFHQDIERAGLPEQVTVKGPLGGTLAETQTIYTPDDVPGAPFVRLPQFVFSREFPAPGVTGDPRQTLVAMAYERDANEVIQFGRVSQITEFGEFDNSTDLVPADTRTTTFEYVPADLDSNLVSLVSVERILAGTAQTGTELRRTLSFYDEDLLPGAPPRGRLTRRVEVLDEPGEPDPTTTFAYDNFGNVTQTTPPRANAGQGGGPTTTAYDDTFETFPTVVTNALGHTVQRFYTPNAECSNAPAFGSGLLYGEQGPNDSFAGRAKRCYDALGRVTLERASDNLAEATTSYDDTPGATQIAVSERTGPGTSRDALMLLDGLGRPLTTLRSGPQGKTIVESQTLDGAGRVVSTLPASFFGEAAQPILTAYDSLDRVQSVQEPAAAAGSPSEPGARTTTTFRDRGTVTVTDPNQNPETRLVDPFGNVLQVIEGPPGSPLTQYTYDVTGNLLQVTDAAGNVTTIDYDRLGRRKTLTDPDSGTTTFQYDAEGNVLVQQGPNGTVTFVYDALGRVQERRVDGVLDQTLTYDTATRGIGLPATVDDDAGQRTVVQYDALGREPAATREIDGFNFSFQASFDPLGQLLTRTLPDGTVISRTYDASGFLTLIAAGGQTQVSSVEFDPQGRVARWVAANGVTTTSTFDAANTRRLDQMQVSQGAVVLERRRFAFDRGSRITSIDDLRDASLSQSFTYDPNDRLLTATGPYAPGLGQTTLHYFADAIGNLRCLDAAGPFNPGTQSCPGGRNLTYPTGGPGVVRPHAPTQVDGQSVAYTASGNLASLGDRVYSYDPLDRLTAVDEAANRLAEFLYTSSGERIRSTDFTGPQTVVTYLLSGDFEFDATRKLSRTHVRLGGAVAATVTQPYAPTPMGARPGGWGMPIPPGTSLALLLAVALGLGLAVQVVRLGRQGRGRLRPALAGSTALALLLATFPGSVWSAPLDGDLNGDGRLDAADVLLGLQIDQGTRVPTAEQLRSGDVAPLELAPSAPSAIDPADGLLLQRAAEGEDVDGDGLGTAAELAAGSSPFRVDTDRDGIDDPTEIGLGTDPAVNPNDTDGDGLTNAQEVSLGTDPFLADTDGDGLVDGADADPLRGTAFHHGDQLSSTTLTTGTGGLVVQRAVYRPFGATVAASAGLPPEDVANATPRFGFTGQRFEAGIGIYDYNARFYDPTLGRFLQPDGLVSEPFDPQTLNRFSYVLNDPVNRIDPSGNIAFVIGAVFALGGAINVGIDAFRGDINSFGDLGRSFTVGGVSAVPSVLLGPVGGGALGGFLGSATDSLLRGELPSLRQLGASTAIGAASGGLGGRIPAVRNFLQNSLRRLPGPIGRFFAQRAAAPRPGPTAGGGPRRELEIAVEEGTSGIRKGGGGGVDFVVGAAGRAAQVGGRTPAGFELSKDAAVRLAGRLEGRLGLKQLDSIISNPQARRFVDANDSSVIRIFDESVRDFGGKGLNVIINPSTNKVVTVFPSGSGFANSARFTEIVR